MEQNTTTGERPVERQVMRVRINVGALVGQDFRSGRWPWNVDENDIDPMMIFDGEWLGDCWRCIADGYGRLKSRGEFGGYGSGAFFVKDFNDVTPIDGERA